MFTLHDATFWAMTAASLFNVILMATLGLTVLLTTPRPRRGLGATLAGLGLLLGAAFFAAHAALLDYDLKALILGVRSWWFFGWSALIALPGAWYALMLWYGGFWDDDASKLHRVHRRYFVGALLAALFLTTLIVWIDPLQMLRGAAQMMISGAPPLREYSRGKPENVGIALFAIYAIYAVSCLGLSLDVVRRPAPSARLMGDVARRRARPWLVATTLLLLLVAGDPTGRPDPPTRTRTGDAARRTAGASTRCRRLLARADAFSELRPGHGHHPDADGARVPAALHHGRGVRGLHRGPRADPRHRRRLRRAAD